jgi:hypothetical protein
VKITTPVSIIGARAEDVGQPAAEQQQPAEEQHVDADRPGEGRTAQVQVGAEVGQGDVDHGEVQDEHELRHADHRERLPAARVRGRLRLARFVRVTNRMMGVVHHGLLTRPSMCGGGTWFEGLDLNLR